MAAWTNMDGELNQSGVALVLALARYFKREHQLYRLTEEADWPLYRVVALVERHHRVDHL